MCRRERALPPILPRLTGAQAPNKNGRPRRLRRAYTLCNILPILLPLEAKEIDVTDAGAERRRHPRLRKPFPATVRGVDAYGESFEADTVLDNLSAGGLYLRLGRCVKQKTKLFVII